jgi:small subunit ribosomal protein S7
MPRRKRVLKRPTILEDKTFSSILVARLINRIMWDGKKTVASKIVTEALTTASEDLQITPVEVLEIALNNVKPQIEVQSMRIGGANYQVPIEPRAERSVRLGLTWIVNSARKIKGKKMSIKLRQILIDSYKGEGPAVAKRNSVHQTASGNKAFAHFALRRKK